MTKEPFFKDLFSSFGFTFRADLNGCLTPEKSGDTANEYRMVREEVAIADLSHVAVFRIMGRDAFNFCDFLICGNVGMLREENILHSIIVDTNGAIVTEAYLAADGEEYILFAEGGDYARLASLMEQARDGLDVKIASLVEDWALFSVDGPYCWIRMSNVFSSEVLGLRYLSFMETEIGRDKGYVLRAGKTGEYGYWVLVPKATANDILDNLMTADSEHQIALYGIDISKLAKLENRFLNLETEGTHVKSPYELGLFWMIDRTKDMIGGSALNNMVKSGINNWVIGFRTPGNVADAIRIGDPIQYEDVIGMIVNSGFSPAIDETIGLALFKKEYAHIGLDYVAGSDRVPIRTACSPFIMNKSLSVRME